MSDRIVGDCRVADELGVDVAVGIALGLLGDFRALEGGSVLALGVEDGRLKRLGVDCPVIGDERHRFAGLGLVIAGRVEDDVFACLHVQVFGRVDLVPGRNLRLAVAGEGDVVSRDRRVDGDGAAGGFKADVACIVACRPRGCRNRLGDRQIAIGLDADVAGVGGCGLGAGQVAVRHVPGGGVGSLHLLHGHAVDAADRDGLVVLQEGVACIGDKLDVVDRRVDVVGSRAADRRSGFKTRLLGGDVRRLGRRVVDDRGAGLHAGAVPGLHGRELHVRARRDARVARRRLGLRAVRHRHVAALRLDVGVARRRRDVAAVVLVDSGLGIDRRVLSGRDCRVQLDVAGARFKDRVLALRGRGNRLVHGHLPVRENREVARRRRRASQVAVRHVPGGGVGGLHLLHGHAVDAADRDGLVVLQEGVACIGDKLDVVDRRVDVVGSRAADRRSGFKTRLLGGDVRRLGRRVVDDRGAGLHAGAVPGLHGRELHVRARRDARVARRRLGLRAVRHRHVAALRLDVGVARRRRDVAAVVLVDSGLGVDRRVLGGRDSRIKIYVAVGGEIDVALGADSRDGLVHDEVTGVLGFKNDGAVLGRGESGDGGVVAADLSGGRIEADAVDLVVGKVNGRDGDVAVVLDPYAVLGLGREIRYLGLEGGRFRPDCIGAQGELARLDRLAAGQRRAGVENDGLAVAGRLDRAVVLNGCLRLVADVVAGRGGLVSGDRDARVGRFDVDRAAGRNVCVLGDRARGDDGDVALVVRVALGGLDERALDDVAAVRGDEDVALGGGDAGAGLGDGDVTGRRLDLGVLPGGNLVHRDVVLLEEVDRSVGLGRDRPGFDVERRSRRADAVLRREFDSRALDVGCLRSGCERVGRDIGRVADRLVVGVGNHAGRRRKSGRFLCDDVAGDFDVATGGSVLGGSCERHIRVPGLDGFFGEDGYIALDGLDDHVARGGRHIAELDAVRVLQRHGRRSPLRRAEVVVRGGQRDSLAGIVERERRRQNLALGLRLFRAALQRQFRGVDDGCRVVLRQLARDFDLVGGRGDRPAMLRDGRAELQRLAVGAGVAQNLAAVLLRRAGHFANRDDAGVAGFLREGAVDLLRRERHGIGSALLLDVPRDGLGDRDLSAILIDLRRGDDVLGVNRSRVDVERRGGDRLADIDVGSGLYLDGVAGGGHGTRSNRPGKFRLRFLERQGAIAN